MIHPQGGFTVISIEPSRSLVTLARTDTKTGRTFDLANMPEEYINTSWVYELDPIGEKTTRLIVRMRSDYRGFANALFSEGPMEFGSFLMFRKMMLGVKERAEAAC